MTRKSYNRNWQWYVKLWKNITPPWRPSANEIMAIREFLRKKYTDRKEKRALILGSTPEFRNLLHQLKFHVTCLDINPEMFKGMSKIVKNSSQDKLVVGSWIDKPFIKNYFDVVLSDEALDNISYDDYDKFHNNVYDFLKTKSCYIYGCYYLIDDSNLPKFLRNGSFEELISFYKENNSWFKNFENKEIIYQGFKKHKAYFRRDKWRFYLGWYDKKVRKLFEQGVIDKKGFQLLTMGFGENARFTQMYQKNYEKFFNKYFKIIKKFSDPDYKYHNKTCYFLQKD